jgi:glutaredoxin
LELIEMFLARPLRAMTGFLGLLAVAGFTGSDANAQQIYRIVGPDGRVTFTDKAPLDPNVRAAAAVPTAVPAAGADNSTLPFELRQAASRYPVTLYSGPGCGPCGQGRTLLSTRGIPFIEKTVNSNEDIEALKRLAGAPSLPFLTIGGQQLRGFSEIEWVQFLDAAGYPRTSQLPPGYAAPPAAPLVAVEVPKPVARPAPERPRAAAPPASPAPSSNPAGITF